MNTMFSNLRIWLLTSSHLYATVYLGPKEGPIEMSQQQASALAQPQPIPVLLGMESVYGMPPGYLVAFTLSERDRLLTHQHLHPAAVTTRPGHLWIPECANQLAHYDLIILAPTDPYSLAYAEQVARDCYSKAAKVRIIRLFGSLPHLGVGGWMQTGGDRARLFARMRETPIYLPSDSLGNSHNQPGANPATNPAANPGLPASTITEAVASVDEMEAIVVLNRILDVVDCPQRCRAYPLAVMSAFYDGFNNDAPLDRFSAFTTLIGGYLTGSKPRETCSRKTLQRRALRAETAFDQWQRASGYTLISRERDSDAPPINLKSLYRTPLITLWAEVLINARQSPNFRQGRRKRAQAIRRAARRIAPGLYVAPDPSTLVAPACPAKQPSRIHSITRLQQTVPATIQKGFRLVSGDRIGQLANQRDNELAGQLVRDAHDLAEVVINAAWTEFNQIVTACIAASVPGAACHTPASAFDLWNRILKPYTTRQIVPS